MQDPEGAPFPKHHGQARMEGGEYSSCGPGVGEGAAETKPILKVRIQNLVT